MATGTTARKKLWKVISFSSLFILAVIGTYSFLHTPADEVRWAYTKANKPFDNVNPLFPDLQGPKINAMLKAMEEATPVADKNLSNNSPTKIDTSANIIFLMKNGQERSVSTAYSCVERGGCSGSAENIVYIENPQKNPSGYYAKSPELYEFLSKSYRIHPPGLVEHPQKVTVGSTFSIEGYGWLTDRVTLNLKKGDEVLWSKDTVPNHGEIFLQVKCPDVASGEYQLEYQATDWKTVAHSITVEKKP